jgi:Lon protease-like protein
MGGSVPPATTELVEDLVLATYQASALAPLGPVDKQRLLEAATPEARVALLAALVGDELTVLDELQGLDGGDDLSGG